MPDWAHEGGLDALLARLRAPGDRARLAREIAEQGREWDQTLVSWMPDGQGKADEGGSIADIAARRGTDPVETLLALLEESSARGMMVHFVMSEDDVRHVMRHPLAMFGSDGWVLTPRGPLAEGKPHPRCYGTYPRILGHYVRETGVLTLEAAVHKAAYRPAEKLGLASKGRVQVGADADLVVFDPATVRDLATYADPHRFPAGIEHVLVAGEMTVRDGRHTGARAGRVLRRPLSGQRLHGSAAPRRRGESPRAGHRRGLDRRSARLVDTADARPWSAASTGPSGRNPGRRKEEASSHDHRAWPRPRPPPHQRAAGARTSPRSTSAPCAAAGSPGCRRR